MKKWCNRFTPILYAVGKNKIMDLTQGTVVDATGLVEGDYEQVIHDGLNGAVTGWVHTDDLEDYIRSFEVDCVVIENQTPDTHDFQQYIIYKLYKQVNMCGELCISYILHISLGHLLQNWELKVPSFFKRIFGSGKARGTGAEELREMLKIFERSSESLATALYQPHIKRARYTIKALNQLLEKGSIIASVKISSSTGLLKSSGVLHWVAIIKVISERNGQGMVKYYNPAMNCIETCSWNEFMSSAGLPYGVFVRSS